MAAMLLSARVASCSPVESEPEYQGKSLDAWLRDLRNPATRDDAATALCKMNPSPAPFLLERMRAEDSASIDFASSLPPSARGWKSANDERGGAVLGLVVLGPRAQAVIPELARMINDPDSRLSDSALRILVAIGTNSAPVLIEALKNTPHPKFAASRRDLVMEESRRADLVNAVRAMGSSARPALPIFLQDLNETNNRTRNSAVLALGKIAPHDPVVVTAFLKCLTDPDDATRRNAAHGLAGISFTSYGEYLQPGFDPLARATNLPPVNAAVFKALFQMAEHDEVDINRTAATYSLVLLDPNDALEAFIKDLQSPEVEIRRRAAWNLGNFRKGARSAVPLLVKLVEDKDAKTRQSAIVALREIGEKPELVVPLLIRHLSDPDPETCAASAEALGVFGGASKSAVPQMIEVLKKVSNDFDTTGIISALYQIDPAVAEHLDHATSNETVPAK